MDFDEERGRRGIEPEPSFAEMVEGGVRRISTSIAIAGALIGLGIYAGRPSTPRFDGFATEKGIVRIDTRTGKMIGCENGRCMTLIQRGQGLAPNPNIIDDDEEDEEPVTEPQKASPPPAQKALPAPATQPAPANQPAQPNQPNPQAAPVPSGR